MPCTTEQLVVVMCSISFWHLEGACIPEWEGWYKTRVH